MLEMKGIELTKIEWTPHLGLLRRKMAHFYFVQTTESWMWWLNATSAQTYNGQLVAAVGKQRKKKVVATKQHPPHITDYTDSCTYHLVF